MKDTAFFACRAISARSLRLEGVEALAAGLLQDAHQIDHVIRPGDRMGDRILVAQIGMDRRDLPDLAEGEEVREVRLPGRHQDPVAALGESADHIAAEKARSAEDGDGLLLRRAKGTDHETLLPDGLAWSLGVQL